MNLANVNIAGVGITAACPQLQKLSFFRSPFFSTFSIDILGNLGLNNILSLWGGALKELNLSGTTITGEGITASCPQLRILNLEGCEYFKSRGLTSLLAQCGDSLEKLYPCVSWNHPAEFEPIYAKYPQMEVIHEGTGVDY